MLFQQLEAKIGANRPLAELLVDLEVIRQKLIANSPNAAAVLGHDTVTMAGSSLSTEKAVAQNVSLGGNRAVPRVAFGDTRNQLNQVDPRNPIYPQESGVPEVTLSKALPNTDAYGASRNPSNNPSYPQNPADPNHPNYPNYPDNPVKQPNQPGYPPKVPADTPANPQKPTQTPAKSSVSLKK